MKNSTKKELSAKVILIVAIVSYSLKFLIGGIIGDSFALLGFICLILGIMRWSREMRAKKLLKKNGINSIPENSAPISKSIQKTTKDNFLVMQHIESLINYFINNEKQMSLIDSDCAVNLFLNGYIPKSEDFNDPQKMVKIDPKILINTPKRWLILRLWLDLANFNNISEKASVPLDKIIADYLEILGKQTDETLIVSGSISKEYDIKDLDNNWKSEIDKIKDKKKKEDFKINYINDILLSAEIRILAWVSGELSGKEFKFKK